MVVGATLAEVVDATAEDEPVADLEADPEADPEAELEEVRHEVSEEAWMVIGDE